MPRAKPISKDSTVKNVTKTTFQLMMGDDRKGVVSHSNKTSPRNFRQQGATLNGRQYGQ